LQRRDLQTDTCTQHTMEGLQNGAKETYVFADGTRLTIELLGYVGQNVTGSCVYKYSYMYIICLCVCTHIHVYVWGCAYRCVYVCIYGCVYKTKSIDGALPIFSKEETYKPTQAHSTHWKGAKTAQKRPTCLRTERG